LLECQNDLEHLLKASITSVKVNLFNC